MPTAHVACDRCRKTAAVQGRAHVPEGWFYMGTRPDPTGPTYFIRACSTACASMLWQPGPGEYIRYEVRLDPDRTGTHRYWIFDARMARPVTRTLMTHDEAIEACDALNSLDVSDDDE